MAGAAVRQADVEVSFELYVRKRGRWLVVDVVRDRQSALKLGQQLAEQKEHEAVKIVRDELDLRTGRNSELVIFDSEIKIAPPPAGSGPRPKAPPRVDRPEPVSRAPLPEPTTGGFPWLALASTVLGLSFAALGFWFIGAIY